MKGRDKLEELVKSYNELQKRIYDVVREFKYTQQDNMVNTLDLLEQAEESFGVNLYDYLLELNEMEGLNEM